MNHFAAIILTLYFLILNLPVVDEFVGYTEDTDAFELKIHQLATSIEVVGGFKASVVWVAFFNAEINLTVDDIKPRIRPLEFDNIVGLKSGRSGNFNQFFALDAVGNADFTDKLAIIECVNSDLVHCFRFVGVVWFWFVVVTVKSENNAVDA